MISTRGLYTLLIAIGFALISPSASRADTAHLTLQSSPGSFVGQGKSYDVTFDSSNSIFFQIHMFSPIAGLPSELQFAFAHPTADPNDDFDMTILMFGTTELGIPLQVGSYQDSIPSPSGTSTPFPYFDFGFRGRTDTFGANFTITDLAYSRNAQNELSLLRLSATFSALGATRGETISGTFDFNSSSTTAVPEPAGLVLLGLGMVGIGGVLRKCK